MKHYQTIQIISASEFEVIIFIDKITHIYTTASGQTMIRLINEQGVLTNLSLHEIMVLISETNGNS